MSGVSFPGSGQDGEQPPPGVPARDETDDFDMDAEMAAYLADVDAGRVQVPDPWEDVPACTISLGEACDVDLAELAVMCGPEGLGGEIFARDRPADAMRPGPVLAALAEQAAGNLDGLSDDALLGVVSAARRSRARAEYLELAAVAEFTRRREAQFAAAKAAKVPRGCRPGEFADAELGMELLTTAAAAGNRMELATALRSRLPHTFAGLAAGVIDADRAAVIWCYTQFLSDEDAAHADAVLAAAAPRTRTDLLARRAARLEMKLDPEAARQRKEHARKTGRRVEARRETSGNACLAGRELAVEDAIAAKACIDADAVALRDGGLEGSLDELRALAYLDRLQRKNPLDRLTRTPAGPGSSPAPTDNIGPAPEEDEAPRDDDDYQDTGDDDGGDDQDTGEDDDGCEGDTGEGDYGDDDEGPGGGPGGAGSGPKGPGTPAGGLTPPPALITLLVPAGTLLGWSHTPGEAGTWGLLDADDTRALVQAASENPRTRWAVTVTGADGTARAHARARGSHPWTPQPRGTSPGTPRGRPPDPRSGDPSAPDAPQAARLAALLRRLNPALAPIAQGACDHRHRDDRYTPGRRLKDLIRARTATCSAPGCGTRAIHCDLDHTTAYPSGMTCECGLGPVCRRHHRCKQAPGWQLEQPEPGLMRWTGPSGRTYTTTPTVYDI